MLNSSLSNQKDNKQQSNNSADFFKLFKQKQTNFKPQYQWIKSKSKIVAQWIQQLMNITHHNKQETYTITHERFAKVLFQRISATQQIKVLTGGQLQFYQGPIIPLQNNDIFKQALLQLCQLVFHLAYSPLKKLPFKCPNDLPAFIYFSRYLIHQGANLQIPVAFQFYLQKIIIAILFQSISLARYQIIYEDKENQFNKEFLESIISMMKIRVGNFQLLYRIKIGNYAICMLISFLQKNITEQQDLDQSLLTNISLDGLLLCCVYLIFQQITQGKKVLFSKVCQMYRINTQLLDLFNEIQITKFYNNQFISLHKQNKQRKKQLMNVQVFFPINEQLVGVQALFDDDILGL